MNLKESSIVSNKPKDDDSLELSDSTVMAERASITADNTSTSALGDEPTYDEQVRGKHALLKAGSKSDRIDARKLAELLRGNHLKPVYHGETGVRMLRELARSYLTIVEGQSRVMSRLKALYRSWAIGCAGRDVYYIRHRTQWLEKLREPGIRRRAERLYEQLAEMQRLRRLARHDLLVESRKHSINDKLRQIPYVGPIRAALLIALLQTPHR